MDTAQIEELARRFMAGLPAALHDMRAELEANFRAALQGAASRYDLASRSEFDVQSRVLERTRERMAELEARLQAVEARLQQLQAPGSPAPGS
jgi:ubiquinone biosynthesis accessory factor UbiK